MRRASGRPNWVRFMKVATGSGAPGGDRVLRLFRLQDFLESTSDDHLLDHRFRLAPEVWLEQRYISEAGGLSPVRTRLHLAAEPAYHKMEVDATVTRLLMCFHGERRLRQRPPHVFRLGMSHHAALADAVMGG